MAVEGARTYRWVFLRVVRTLPDSLEICRPDFFISISDAKFGRSLTDGYCPVLEGVLGSVDSRCTSIAMLFDEEL
jgi:hypothetical protein